MKKALVALFILTVFTASSKAFGTPIVPEAASLYNEAEGYFKQRNLQQAELSLSKALVLEPDNAVYRYILGQVQYLQQNYLSAKNNFEIVSRSRVSQEKGDDYNSRLRNFKKNIKNMQAKMSEAGNQRFEAYKQNENSPQKLKLAVTVYQAFKLNPGLRYKNVKLLENVTKIYEQALARSLSGETWQKDPMMQLAFLYEISNKKDKAAEIYMRALDYVNDSNEEFVVTHRFDYLNRSNKEKLLDTIEAGEFTRQDFEEILGDKADGISEEDKQKFDDMANDAKDKLENAATDEERNQVLEDIKNELLAKQKSGEIKLTDKMQKKLDKEGKTVEDYLKEQGL